MPSNGYIELHQGNVSGMDKKDVVQNDQFSQQGYHKIPMQERFYGSILETNLEDNFAEVEKMESLPPSSYASTAIVVVCVLIGDMARGILFPSLWLLVQSLSGSKVYQGFAVSAFSAGRILSSPLFGWLSEKYGYRNVLITCNAIVFFGCYMYSLSKTVNGVILGQFIIGIGAGSLGVTRSYVAEKTHRTERTLYMAYMTAVQYAGFTMTPILGAMLSALAYQDLENPLNAHFVVNQYSLPVFFLMVVCVLAILLLCSVFVDVPRGTPTLLRVSADVDETFKVYCGGLEVVDIRVYIGIWNSQTSRAAARSALQPDFTESSETVQEKKWWGWTTPDLVAFGGCLLNMSSKGTIGVFETLGLYYMMTHYQWSSLRAGLTVTVCGTLGVVSLLSFGTLLKMASDMDLVLYGMLTMLLASFMLALLTLPVWEFYVVIVMVYSLGYPIGHTALLGLFSKIMKSGPQGKLLGYFGSAGSLARVIFPILAGVLTEYYGERLIFMLMSILLLLSCVVFVRFRETILEVVS